MMTGAFLPFPIAGNEKCPAAREGVTGRKMGQGNPAIDGAAAQAESAIPGRKNNTFRKSLPPLADDGNLDSPNLDSHSRRLARFQDGAKDLNITASNARIGLVHIGGVQRPGTCEGPAAYREPGSVVTLPFSFNPLILEVLHG